MSFLTKLLRFALPVTIVLIALQLVVLTGYKTDNPPAIAEIPVPSKVYEFRTKVLDWLTAPLYQVDSKGAFKSIALFLYGLSLEERQQYLEDFTRILETKLRDSGLEDHTGQVIDDFIKEMNERGID